MKRRILSFEYKAALLIVATMLTIHLGANLSALAQDQGNRPAAAAARLCIHNGCESFYKDFYFLCSPNHGGGKYFPSFAHWTSTSVDHEGEVYPWKIAGWSWIGLQGLDCGDDWYWESCLQKSMDNPWQSTMSFDYPKLYADGVVSPSGPPMPIYGYVVPSTVPDIDGNAMIFPSSCCGFDPYLNIFAVVAASWVVPGTRPYYAYEFSFLVNCASAWTVPSTYSIWEWVWDCKGTHHQYLGLSDNESDCIGGPGNKGRCYSMIGNVDYSHVHYWENYGYGVSEELGMCLYLCDTVSVLVNIPGASNSANPFASYGFDVGSATLTPYISSHNLWLGFMTEDGWGLGGDRIALGAFSFYDPCIGPYGKNNYRIPHGWDLLTDSLLGIAGVFLHTPQPGYPACMVGTTCGDHSDFLYFPYSLGWIGIEVRWSTYAMNPGQPMSASYMATYF